MKILNRWQAGFTLLELMVVIAVIGILVTIASGSFVSSQIKSRDARRKSDLSNISKALELYYNDHGRYPPASAGRIAGCATDSESPCSWGQEFADENNTVYMDTLPREHKDGFNYVYVSSADGTMYQLFARLENVNDRITDFDGDGVSDEYAVSCGDENCNFAITSPNTSGSDSL